MAKRQKKSWAKFFNEVEYEEIQLNKGQTQRIIMVAGNFRKEVTSTVLWLMNYKLRIQCFKVTPYALEEQLFLDIEQIIPMTDSEEYIISMADKTQEDIDAQVELKTRHYQRLEFWKMLLKEMNSRSSLFQNVNQQKTLYTQRGSKRAGFNFVVSLTTPGLNY